MTVFAEKSVSPQSSRYMMHGRAESSITQQVPESLGTVCGVARREQGKLFGADGLLTDVCGRTCTLLKGACISSEPLWSVPWAAKCSMWAVCHPFMWWG
jgi:hypothetical protein